MSKRVRLEIEVADEIVEIAQNRDNATFFGLPLFSWEVVEPVRYMELVLRRPGTMVPEWREGDVAVLQTRGGKKFGHWDVVSCEQREEHQA